MNTDRRLTLMAGLAGAALLADAARAAAPTEADAQAEAELGRQVDAFRQAQWDGDAARLAGLCLPELSYSHSDGHLEDRATFVTNASNGRYSFSQLEFRQRSLHIVGPAAVVRFEWVARQTWKDGKVTDTHMAVLMVWLRQGESWQLLARSATKLG